MAKADYYAILEVEKNADAEVLKKAYRKKAMRFHPDRNPGDKTAEAKFKEISEAYEVLKDEQKRAAYDRFGHAAFDPAQGGRPGGAGFEANFGAGSSFADVFDDLFGEFMGGRRGGRGAARGADLRYNLGVSLEDAYAGKQVTVRVPAQAACEACTGSGSTGGTQPVTCGTCGGAGKVRAQQGFFTIERTCPTCHGSGRIIRDPCRVCSGSGRVHKEKTLSVKIPAGVEDGTRIRLSGEGEAGVRGSPAGDLYIFVSVTAHRLFQRDGANIYCRVPIPMALAALGGQIDVPTVGGTRARLTIPEGTQSGHQFRLKGKGMPVMRGQGQGDMYVQAVVETPMNLNKRQRELLQEFQRTGGRDTHPESEGFFAKVKELWEDLKD
ncbi:MAG: molecular chaperone DnaJ [Alphaproteobacteria bacterium]|nr:molecular chaperone DnaJ [Alphaproteobacteria bacterium]